MKLKERVVVSFCLLLIIASVSGWWLLRTKSEITINHAEGGVPRNIGKDLQEVAFCGVTYYAKPAVLFGIDMLARIAEVATARYEVLVCDNLLANTDPSEPLSTEVRYRPLDPSGIHDYLRIEFFQFSFDPATKQIFLHDVFDGTPRFFGTFQ